MHIRGQREAIAWVVVTTLRKRANTLNQKLIPVLLDPAPEDAVPLALRPFTNLATATTTPAHDDSAVLVICTAGYKRRFEGREESGKGKGATWEGLLAIGGLDLPLHPARPALGRGYLVTVEMGVNAI